MDQKNHVTKATCNFAPACWCVLIVLGLTAGVSRPAFAFDDPPARAARLNYTQGDVSFQPGGENDWTWASVSRPMTTGDSLWTEKGSRAEMHIGSTAIRVNQRTDMSFLNLDDRIIQIQLNSGSLNVHVRRLPRDETYEIDTPNVAVVLLHPGDYRIDADSNGDFTSLAVRDGDAEIDGGGQAFTVEAGSQAEVSGATTLNYNIYDLPDQDEFDRWSRNRDRRFDHSRSARYVSSEVTGYEDLDTYGVWRTDPSYGPVWVPRRVSQDWAPYREGRWAWVDPWGWTWLDDAPWGYATSHYGRWAHSGYGWSWVPPGRDRYAGYEQRPVYSPANVTFLAGSGNFRNSESVAWFPLAPGEVYVPAYRTSPNYIIQLNISNTRVRSNDVTIAVNNPGRRVNYQNQRVEGAVIAVPKTSFSSSQPVSRAAVRISSQEAVSAAVVHTAPVAPVKESVLGGKDEGKTAASSPPPRPPEIDTSRPVVAKATPPGRRVSFERKRQALTENAGKPLDPEKEQSLRASAPPATQVVKAPPAPEARAAASLPRNRQPPRHMPGRPPMQALTPPETTPAIPESNPKQAETPVQQRLPEQQQTGRDRWPQRIDRKQQAEKPVEQPSAEKSTVPPDTNPKQAETPKQQLPPGQQQTGHERRQQMIERQQQAEKPVDQRPAQEPAVATDNNSSQVETPEQQSQPEQQQTEHERRQQMLERQQQAEKPAEQPSAGKPPVITDNNPKEAEKTPEQKRIDREKRRLEQMQAEKDREQQRNDRQQQPDNTSSPGNENQ